MKPVVLCLLTASLVANAMMAGLIRRSPPAPATPPLAGSRSTAMAGPVQPVIQEASPVSAGDTPPRDPVARAVKDPTLSDPKTVAEKMKNDGYPDGVILSGTSGTLIARNNGEYARLEFLGNQRWAEGSAAAKKAFAVFDQEAGALFMEISKDLPDSIFNPQVQARNRDQVRYLTYGDLPENKVSLIQSIEIGYNATHLSYGGGFRFGGILVAANADLAAEGRNAQGWNDLQVLVRRVLTPEEADDYLRYNTTLNNSPTGIVQRLLGDLSIEQTTYISLADEANAIARDVPADQLTIALLPALREKLGDESFLSVAPKVDLQTGGIIDFLRANGASTAVQASAFLAAHTTLTALRSLGPAEAAALAARTRQSIIEEAGLGPDQISAFDQTYAGRIMLARVKSQ